MIFAIGTVSCVNAENLDNATLADCGQEVMADDLHEDICSVGRDCDSVQEIGSQKSVESAVSTIPAEIKISQSGSYYGEKTLKVKVIDENKTALYPIPVSLKFSNGKTATVITKSNGEATYKLPFNPGNYGVVAKIDSNIFKYAFDNSLLYALSGKFEGHLFSLIRSNFGKHFVPHTCLTPETRSQIHIVNVIPINY